MHFLSHERPDAAAASGARVAQPSDDKESQVFVVEDDDELRGLLVGTLARAGHGVASFPDAERFLDAHRPEDRGVLLLDDTLPGMSGLDLQAELARRKSALAVLFLTGTTSVPRAVRAIQAGAHDVLVKPVPLEHLLARVKTVREEQRLAGARHRAATELVRALTPRELEVAELVASGLANKDVAMRLGISHRTVEVHRARVMKKLQVGSAVELAKRLGLVRPRPS